MITLGIEILARDGHPWLEGKRLGLLCNQASTDSRFRHSRDIVNDRFPGRLSCLFSPQHGFFSDRQDNMVESDHLVDRATGLPVFSLYGETRRPTAEMFRNIDVLLVDLQDVGTRVYTFIYTMAYCLEAAAEYGKKVVVLDRPNPIGGELVEGNILQSDLFSFVGLYPMPMRHGLTIGELARLFNDHFGFEAEIEVIRAEGWRRKMLFRDTGLPWLFPSPNMPTPETALVYPGQVIWEGTNISEGRGTCLPFELFGAPFINHGEVSAKLADTDLPGCLLRPVAFEPTSNKFARELCNGFHVQVVDPQQFRPYRTSLALLQALMGLYPDDFAYKEPPYEYEYEKLPMDLIIGNREILAELENGVPVAELERRWQNDLQEFDRMRRDWFLYD
ncbi:MAG: DUF1343 domain-containing protein [Proteobacteria bacterium]|nr:DUF1343 domain-containing protein [Pseudomonadota bacterium]MBU1739855.1 DUF1343 domain-containing protein [Pseudomonadota bacterium]